MPRRLPILDAEVADRVAAVVAARPDWPCRKGCDDCCRHLAEPLRLSRAEWRRLESGMARLPDAIRRDVERRLDETGALTRGPLTCPLLDRDSGACRVYDERPVVCRTYGFYRDRDGGRYCGRIEEKIEREGDDGIVWGNHEAIDRRLERAFGIPISWIRWRKERR